MKLFRKLHNRSIMHVQIKEEARPLSNQFYPISIRSRQSRWLRCDQCSRESDSSTHSRTIKFDATFHRSARLFYLLYLRAFEMRDRSRGIQRGFDSYRVENLTSGNEWLDGTSGAPTDQTVNRNRNGNSRLRGTTDVSMKFQCNRFRYQTSNGFLERSRGKDWAALAHVTFSRFENRTRWEMNGKGCLYANLLQLPRHIVDKDIV